MRPALFRRRSSILLAPKWLTEENLADTSLPTVAKGAVEDVPEAKFDRGDAELEEEPGCYLVIPATDSADERIVKLPLLHPTEGFGNYCVDVRQLFTKTGITTYDPGFMSTASCHSGITHIDGNNSLLMYRGYEISDLCAKGDFMDVSYLLLYGELPTATLKEEHSNQIKQHLLVHENMKLFFAGFGFNAHPMAIMTAVTAALSSFYHDNIDLASADDRLTACYRLIAKVPTLAAMAYKKSVGEPFIYPQEDLSFAENILHMMFSVPSRSYKASPTMVEALDKFLMLHADHAQNASTSTVRLSGSSRANPYTCISSGIASLWGSLHGGANEAVLKMLDEIGSADAVPEFVEKAARREVKIMGFGHRVYKSYDPRALIMKSMCDRVLAELDVEDPRLEVAKALEEQALQHEFFTKRNLFPNIDFYSGIMLTAMGIPTSMFTVLFAVARTVGWISHWKEMIAGGQRIGRPRQLYVGPPRRAFIPVEERQSNGNAV